MSQALVEFDASNELSTQSGDDLDAFVTFIVADQMFGIPILNVQDILSPDRIAPVPLAPKEVKGSINLRGRIVTVIDVRVRLGMDPVEFDTDTMGVTVEHGPDLYTLLVDQIGDVVSLDHELFERNPATLDAEWREFCAGVYRLDGQLMVVLDIERLLDISYEGSL